MPHLTDEQLALLATAGEPELSPDAVTHLHTCPVCQNERAVWAELTAALRDPQPLERPSAAVWERIAVQLGAPDAGSAPSGGSRRATGGGTADAGSVPAAGSSTPAGGTVTPLRRRNDRPWIRRIALAAAASFALGVGSMAAWNTLAGRPSVEVIQSIGLEPLPGWSAEGSASLKSVNGELVLVVDLPDVAVDGYREVWLIDREVQRLVSLGTMNGDHAEFAIPAGLDLQEYVIVDVSREDFDGDPTHSGDSIVRGTFA